ncbi:DUF92 domain-containing protein [Clostridium amazonitimonense]|uniref:DUF92 domain-containing protein n=1 Tax=Clostridium amazonitimonense TaxID=1499689 RepID=UPI0005098347|nr:DUF92 domain-containing protein [Clostridium amazonitimonense]
MLEFSIGFILSFIIAFLAYKKNSLNKSGFIAATFLGTLIYYFGGFYFSFIMISFFLSSSILTKFKNPNKKSLDNINAKGANRDFIQVFANGGVGLIFAFLYYTYKNPVFLLAYATSFAEANADTWASEIGVLSKKDPISILTGKPLKKGMSGGVSFLGTLSSFLGSTFIGVILFFTYYRLYPLAENKILYSILCVFIGFIGCLIDSILGASMQAQYYCEELDTITEKSYYKNKPNKLIKGIAIINNDTVNILSNIIASLIAIALYNIISLL